MLNISNCSIMHIYIFFSLKDPPPPNFPSPEKAGSKPAAEAKSVRAGRVRGGHKARPVPGADAALATHLWVYES